MAQRKLSKPFRKSANLNLTGEPKLHGPRQMNQNEIARATGLDPTTISKALNHGRYGLNSMNLIADAIGMSLDQFRATYERKKV